MRPLLAIAASVTLLGEAQGFAPPLPASSRLPSTARSCARMADVNPWTSGSNESPLIHYLDSLRETPVLKDLKKSFRKANIGYYDRREILGKLKDYIASAPVVIFTTSTCGFCFRAKELLDEIGAYYTEVDLDKEEDGTAMQLELAEYTGRSTVPAVFIDKLYVGGCLDGGLGGVVPLHEQGRLQFFLWRADAMTPPTEVKGD